MARPKKDVDLNLVEKLCTIHCTKQEICDIIEIDEKTLTRHVEEKYNESFADFYKRFMSQGKMGLRRKQYEVAMKGNVSMLIWLGKQYLGQTEKHFGDEETLRPFVLAYDPTKRLVSSERIPPKTTTEG